MHNTSTRTSLIIAGGILCHRRIQWEGANQRYDDCNAFTLDIKSHFIAVAGDLALL